MKKIYITPAVKVKEVKYPSLLAGSTVGSSGNGVGGYSTEPIDAGAKFDYNY